MNGNTSLDAIEMLKKLKGLLDMGAITQQGFEDKKADLMQHISFSSDKVNLGKDTINAELRLSAPHQDGNSRSTWVLHLAD